MLKFTFGYRAPRALVAGRLDALRGAEIRAFIDWVAKKPPDFYTRTRTSKDKKRRRREI